MPTATGSTVSDGLIAHQQQMLDAIQKNTSGTITKAFSEMIAAVMPSAARFRSAYQKELQRVQDEAEDDSETPHVSLYWLVSSGMLKELVDAINDNMEKAAKETAPAIQQGQQQAAQAGQVSATAMSAQAAGVAVSNVQQPAQPTQPDEGTDETIDGLPGDTSGNAKKAIMAGVLAGLGGQALMQGVQTVLTGALQSMLGLGESSAAQAMQQGASLLISANSGLLDGWIWTAEGGACFPAYVQVRTQRGDIPIAWVEAGDYVLTHRGRWRKVTKRMQRLYYGEIHSIGADDRSIHATSEHPFLVERQGQLDWIEARNIRLNDRLVRQGESRAQIVDHDGSDDSIERRIRQADDRIAVRLESERLARVPLLDAGLSMPIHAVDLQDQIGSRDEEVYRRSPTWKHVFLKKVDAQLRETMARIRFWLRLSNVPPVAPHRAETTSLDHRWNQAKRLATIDTLHQMRRTSAYLRAVGARSIARAENCATANTRARREHSPLHSLSDWMVRTLRSAVLAGGQPITTVRIKQRSTAFAGLGDSGYGLTAGYGAVAASLAPSEQQISFATCLAGMQYLGLSAHALPSMRVDLLEAAITARRAEATTTSAHPSSGDVEDSSALLTNSFHTHSISHLITHPHGNRTVYNLEVEEDNSYIANGFVVHNCIACLEMDGSFHTWDEDMDSHPNCGCMQVPYSGPQSGLDQYAGQGEDWFNAQDDAVQAEILGPSKYLAWKNGDLQLMDLVSKEGGFIHERSLKDLGLDFRDYLQQLPTKRELLQLPDISLLGPHPMDAVLTDEERTLLEEAQLAYAAEVPKLPEINVPGDTMGYQITDTNGGIAKLNAAFGHELTDDEIGSLVGAQKGDFVEVDGVPPLGTNTIASFTLHSSDWNGIEDITSDDYEESNVWAGRTLKYDSDGKLTMDNDGFYVQNPGEGTGARYFADEVDGLSSQGVDHIETNAVGGPGDPQYNGYYTWARFGYQADLSGFWENFRDYNPGVRIPKGLKGLDLQELMLEPKGPAFWKKYGEGFGGVFDLADGSTSREVLDGYLQAKGIATAATERAAEETATTAEVSPEVKALQDQRATLATQRDAVQSKLDALSEKWRAAVLDQAKYDPEDDAEEWAAAEKKIASIEKQQSTQMKKLDTLNGKMAKVDAKIQKAMPVAQAAEPPEVPTPRITELPSVASYPLPEIDQEAEDKLVQQIQDVLGTDTGVAGHTEAIALGDKIQGYLDDRLGPLADYGKDAQQIYLHPNDLSGDQIAWRAGVPSAVADHGGMTVQEAMEQYHTALQQETIRLLDEARGVGVTDLELADGAPDLLADTLRQVQEAFPTEWLDASNEDGQLTLLEEDRRRGYYRSGTTKGNGFIGLRSTEASTPDELYTAMAHELGHRMEDSVDGVWQMERDFYNARTAGEQLKSLAKEFNVLGMTKEDKFANGYIGKEAIRVVRAGGLPAIEHYELLSSGLEWVLGTDWRGSYWLARDEEFHQFILGILFGKKAG